MKRAALDRSPLLNPLLRQHPFWSGLSSPAPPTNS